MPSYGTEASSGSGRTLREKDAAPICLVPSRPRLAATLGTCGLRRQSTAFEKQRIVPTDNFRALTSPFVSSCMQPQDECATPVGPCPPSVDRAAATLASVREDVDGELCPLSPRTRFVDRPQSATPGCMRPQNTNNRGRSRRPGTARLSDKDASVEWIASLFSMPSRIQKEDSPSRHAIDDCAVRRDQDPTFKTDKNDSRRQYYRTLATLDSNASPGVDGPPRAGVSSKRARRRSAAPFRLQPVVRDITSSARLATGLAHDKLRRHYSARCAA